MVPLDDLAGGLADLHGRGLRLVGADESAPLAFRDADLRGPLALVVGSEGRGISGHIRRRIDLSVRIPMRGKVGSLNAAVAGSVLLFEAAAQRPGGAPWSRPRDVEPSDDRRGRAGRRSGRGPDVAAEPCRDGRADAADAAEADVPGEPPEDAPPRRSARGRGPGRGACCRARPPEACG